MTTDWIDLNDLQAVAIAQSKGWEIQRIHSDGEWRAWKGQSWRHENMYRGRPKPEERKITIPCYFTGNGLIWSEAAHPNWTRVPSEDKTVEVPLADGLCQSLQGDSK